MKSIVFVLFFLCFSPLALSYPDCLSVSSDTDGDGYGWENNQSCRVTSVTSKWPLCSSDQSDPDGDGYGWENNQSCIVSAYIGLSSPYPTCVSTDSDSDGDGYGWEMGQTCIVSNSDVNLDALPSCSSIDLDPDRDTWGWENGKSCNSETFESLLGFINGKQQIQLSCRNLSYTRPSRGDGPANWLFLEPVNSYTQVIENPVLGCPSSRSGGVSPKGFADEYLFSATGHYSHFHTRYSVSADECNQLPGESGYLHEDTDFWRLSNSELILGNDTYTRIEFETTVDDLTNRPINRIHLYRDIGTQRLTCTYTNN